jgi:sortase A
MSRWTGRVLGTLFLVAGLSLLVQAGVTWARRSAWQAIQTERFAADAPAELGAERATEPNPSLQRSAPLPGAPLARLRLERLGIDVVVAEGTDHGTLSLGPGHMRGSGLPGEDDNCIIAGHRDGAFGQLREVREGDVVEVSDEAGMVRYRISWVGVVEKDDASALAPSADPILTLVTCHPFNHLGPAPRRLVVRGYRIGDVTDPRGASRTG